MCRFLTYLFSCLLVLMIASLNGTAVHAQDIVKVMLKQSAIDQRGDYKFDLIKMILDASRDRFGSYEIIFNPKMRRKRAYVEMLKGDIVNLYVAPADREWEAAMTPIRIPKRKGLLNYRILLINKDTAPAFAKVKSNADLMKLQVGLRPGWTTTKIMRALKFNITEGAGYDGLFKMLNANRFDYIPRGNGKFDALFNQAFSKSISRANLPNRKIFNVGNPLLSKQTPLQDETLWFYPFRTN